MTMRNPMDVDEEDKQTHKNSQEENKLFYELEEKKTIKVNQSTIQYSKAKAPKINVKESL